MGSRRQSLAAIEMAEDALGERSGNPIHGFQIRKLGLRHPFGRTEVLQERLLSGRANARNFIQRILFNVSAALGPVRSDGPTVGFIA